MVAESGVCFDERKRENKELYSVTTQTKFTLCTYSDDRLKISGVDGLEYKTTKFKCLLRFSNITL